MEIEEVKERIKKIREDIGQDTSTSPRIKWIKDDEVLIICGYHRSDKSMLIGPGGWVAGRLSEEIGKPVTVIESTEELVLSLIHISEPTRLLSISYAVFCLKKKKPITKRPLKEQ